MNDMEPNSMHETNSSTCVMLITYADTEFVRWVDWASRFGQMLGNSQLTEKQKQVVRCVACLEVVE